MWKIKIITELEIEQLNILLVLLLWWRCFGGEPADLSPSVTFSIPQTPQSYRLYLHSDKRKRNRPKEKLGTENRSEVIVTV